MAFDENILKELVDEIENLDIKLLIRLKELINDELQERHREATTMS